MPGISHGLELGFFRHGHSTLRVSPPPPPRLELWSKFLRYIFPIEWNVHRSEERRPRRVTTADDKSLGANGTRPPMNLPTAVVTDAVFSPTCMIDGHPPAPDTRRDPTPGPSSVSTSTILTTRGMICRLLLVLWSMRLGVFSGTSRISTSGLMR